MRPIGWILLAWTPFILISGLIFFFSSQTELPIPEAMLFPNLDKVAHLLIFSTLGFCAAMGVFSLRKNMQWPSWILSILISAVYGALDEFHQHFVPNREVSIWDWSADITGAIIGVSVWFCWCKYRSAKKQKLKEA